jgi:hypothetical protein
MEIRKAERRKAKLRLGIASVSGAGKTYSALMLAFGIGGKIGMVDTENGSGDLYSHLGEYDIIPIKAPFTVAKYKEALNMFETSGYTTVILDSLSHAWAGDGGLLDKQGRMADTGGNSYAAWRKVTPEHNALVESMLQSPCHVIATMRSKQEYVQEKNEHGKTIIRKVGLAPVQRDGMEYEFTVMMDITNPDHIASTTKDRTGLFDGQFFKITKETGKTLLTWLESGKDVPIPAIVAAPEKPAASAPAAAAQPAGQPAPVKTARGIIETIKSAKTAAGMRYGVKLKGSTALYGTASAPAAQRAESMTGSEIEVSYKEEGGKLLLVGFDLVKA